MPTPDFHWITYPVEKEHLTSLRALTIGVTEPAAARTTIELPDFSPYPTPLEKAKVLLSVAAEVEHALLVQYLYSAYSLHAPADETDPQHKALLQRSRSVIVGIAKEEMGHLLSVQNLHILLGLPLTLERDEMPIQKKPYPFPMHLEPLSRRSLAKFVVAEAPPEPTGIDDIIQLATGAAGQLVNHVAVLYALVGLVVTKAGDLDKNASLGPWYAMVRDLAQYAFKQQPPDAWHLKDQDFHADSFSQQGKESEDEWGTQGSSVHVFAMHGRTEALAALNDISIQGEGSGMAVHSHFERFLGIFRGSSANPPVPFPGPGEWQPARDVPTDPRIPSLGDVPGPGDITFPKSQSLARLANLRYALLLGYIEHSLLVPLPDRKFLIDQAFEEMTMHLRPLSSMLTLLAQRKDGTGVAALPFTLPPLNELHLPASAGDDRKRWLLHKRRLDLALQLEAELGLDPSADQAAPKVIEQHIGS
jgi:hypothetical protein